MNSWFATILDRDVSCLVRAIGEGYEAGTLQFLEAYHPAFRAELDRAEERLGHVRNDLLAGNGTLAEWSVALDELRGLWELAGQLRRDHEEREAMSIPEETELVGAEA